MLDSLANVGIRKADVHLLKNTVDPQLVPGLAPYLNETDSSMLGDIYYCLALNQQVIVIPYIADLEEKLAQHMSGTDAVLAIKSYKTEEAVPYLNPLLFSTDYSLRINAMLALDKLANGSSTPYLVLALRDPDPQRVVPGSAYVTLHKSNPAIGHIPDSALDSRYYYTHTEELKQPIYAWWSDELLGKHLKPGEHPVIPTELPNTPALLNPLLFIPDTPTRRAVADKLNRLGDRSSIPYLILAPQDPDPEPSGGCVSYVAYKTLHRLIPTLGPAEASGAFAASPEAAKQPIYHWWQDELMGKHLSQ